MILPLRSFYFLRHGETDWNREGRLQGRTDIPLNGRGLRQAQEAGALLAGSAIAAIYTSPLQRALLTAEIVAAILHVPLHIIPDLAECDFALWEGRRKGAWLEAWRRGKRPPGDNSDSAIADRDRVRGPGEDFGTFRARILRGLAAILTGPYSLRSGLPLIVAHTGLYEVIEEEGRLLPGTCFALRQACPVRLDPPVGEGDAPWISRSLIAGSLIAGSGEFSAVKFNAVEFSAVAAGSAGAVLPRSALAELDRVSAKDAAPAAAL